MEADLSRPIDYGSQRIITSDAPPIQEPYPPRSFEELRLTAILERIERRLTAIEAATDARPK